MSQSRRRSGKKKLTIALVIFLIILGLLAAFLVIYPMLLPKVDPFDYAEVLFTGDTGYGVADVAPRTDLVGADASKITYTLSKNSNLSNGETVTLSAESRAYRLTETTKNYEVTGLNEYLRDVKELGDASIAAMHEYSEAIMKTNMGDPASSFGVQNEQLSSRPSIIWLLTADDGSNILYDVYRTTFRKADGGEKVVFLVNYYKNVKVNPNEEGSFAFDTSMYRGNVISIGDAIEDSVITGYGSLKAAKAALVEEEGKGMKVSYIKAPSEG